MVRELFKNTVATVVLVLCGLLSSLATAGDRPIRLLVATSVADSGLIDVLVPAFEQQTGMKLQVNVYGSGRVLRNARDGFADVTFTHAPEAEQQLVKEGFVSRREEVMSNEFVVLGPASDPAGIKDAHSITEAFSRIADTGAYFVSRGDDGATHKKELSLWQLAKREPFGRWYIEYGDGQGHTLQYASERQAYALSDMGTWLAYRHRLKLSLLFRGDPHLANVYHVMAMNQQKNPAVNAIGAEAFVSWLLSAEAKRLIGSYTMDGELLFVPSELK